MKRGSVFFIGLASAILTIISLNYALGNRRNGFEHDDYKGYHHCYDKRNNDRNHEQNNQQKSDSSNSNY